MPFVIDNSVVAGWYLENQATPDTQAIAKRMENVRAHAPALWGMELVNVLRNACLRQCLTAQHPQLVLTQLSSLPIEVDRPAVLPSELLALSLRYGLSSYDAAYLEWALRRQVPMATRDEG